MYSESDDDAPLAFRGKPKGATNAPSLKGQGLATKNVAVKTEVKEEEVHGSKGLDNKAKQAKELDKKAPAKGKVGAKALEAQNGKEAAASKKVKEEGKQPKEKKEYDMPGQTRDPPPETDSLRKFYTSLLEQRPESEMAKKWCNTHGLLSREAAEEFMAQLKKTKPAAKSPVKPSSRSDGGKGAAAKVRRPAEKAPAAKRQRHAVSTPPRKLKVEYSDEEPSSSSSDKDGDDVAPMKRGKPVAKAGSAAAAMKAVGDSNARRRIHTQKLNGACVDGGLDGSSNDDDIPLGQRVMK